MSNSDPVTHKVVTFDDPDNASATALLNGRVPFPVDLTRVALDQTVADALSNSSVSLAVAAALYEGGDHREAARWTLRAARDVFGAVGATPQQLAPIRHLFDALSDLETGAIDPMLKPAAVKGRRPDPTTDWNARAYAAAAMDIEMSQGAREALAAKRIAKRIDLASRGRSVSSKSDDQRLLAWRKRFIAGTAPAGQTIFKLVLDMAADRPESAADFQNRLVSLAISSSRI